MNFSLLLSQRCRRQCIRATAAISAVCHCSVRRHKRFAPSLSRAVSTEAGLETDRFFLVATPLGLEPRITPPKGAVLPLHHGVPAQTLFGHFSRKRNIGAHMDKAANNRRTPGHGRSVFGGQNAS